MPRTGLLLDARGVLVGEHGEDRVGDAGRAYIQRMALAGVPVVVIADDQTQADGAIAYGAMAPPPVVVLRQGGSLTLRGLMQALTAAEIEVISSWLITADGPTAQTAAAAGVLGVVMVGASAPVVGLACAQAQARDFADAPRVMIPPRGGCWHDHR